MLNKDLIRHGMEFSRAIANHQYERSPKGLYFPKQRAVIQGMFDTWINGADHQCDPNEVPVQALNYLLKAGYKNSGGLGTWYIAPFVNNVTPASTLTAATATGTLGEFTTYNELTRVAWTLPADPTSGSFSNSASPAAFTAATAVGTGAGIDVYGAFIVSASAKSATSGTIGPASKFSAARNLKATDILTVQYTLNATSTA